MFLLFEHSLLPGLFEHWAAQCSKSLCNLMFLLFEHSLLPGLFENWAAQCSKSHCNLMFLLFEHQLLPGSFMVGPHRRLNYLGKNEIPKTKHTKTHGILHVGFLRILTGF